MSEWKEAKLNEIAVLSKDSWKPIDEEAPYIGLEHIAEAKLRLLGTGHSREVNSNKYHFKNDEFLFGKLRPYFRKVVRPKIDGICSTDIWVVKNKKEYDLDFVFYLFANQDFIDLAYSGSSGTRMPRADWKFMKDTEWMVPVHIVEQKAIADILSSLDDKIDLLHRQNETLEAMAQSLFRQWFVEEAGVDWEEKPLDEIAEYLNGLACQKYPPEDDSNKLPVLKIRELRNGVTDKTDWATTEVDEKYIVKNGDVIFSWSGSLMVKIWNGKTCVLNQHLFSVTSEQYPKWFYYLWTIYHLRKFQAIAESKATTMGHIKRKDLKNSVVFVPADTELEKKSLLFAPLFEKKIGNNRQIRTLEKLRDTLLPKLMSGKVRVQY